MAGAILEPGDSQLVFLPLMSHDGKCLPVHFITQQEVSHYDGKCLPVHFITQQEVSRYYGKCLPVHFITQQEVNRYYGKSLPVHFITQQEVSRYDGKWLPVHFITQQEVSRYYGKSSSSRKRVVSYILAYSPLIAEVQWCEFSQVYKSMVRCYTP